jgi:hypothetical protein
MANSKLFTVAGTSTLNGINTYRFATGKPSVRAAKLKRHGHTDISLQELSNPMTKEDAVSFLTSQGIVAVVPTNRKSTPVELTDEQKAAAEKERKKAEFVARMAAARAAKLAAKQAVEDAAFFAEQAGDTEGAAALLAAAEEGAEETAEEGAAALLSATEDTPAVEPTVSEDEVDELLTVLEG